MPPYLLTSELRLLSPGGDIPTYIFRRTEPITQCQVQDPFSSRIPGSIQIGINIPNGWKHRRVEVWAKSARAMQACDIWGEKENL